MVGRATPTMFYTYQYLPRSKEDGTATRVDAICTYHPDPKGHRLDREQLYWEMNRLTHGVTRLGPYTLDRNSLYVDGKHLDVAGFFVNWQHLYSGFIYPPCLVLRC